MSVAEMADLSDPKHCCERMKEEVAASCDTHNVPFDCPDNVIFYSERANEYGLIIHDGGSSYMVISYCPFCGNKLNKRND